MKQILLSMRYRVPWPTLTRMSSTTPTPLGTGFRLTTTGVGTTVEFQAEDREIISRVSHFLISAFADRPPAQWAIDVGSGTNLYPALLMLPWTEQILLADYSESNVGWLQDQIADDTDPWAWRPFWREMREAKGYSDVDGPRKRLREACVGEPGYAGIERLSIFDLPEARWDLGTMFFVAESITKEPEEFRRCRRALRRRAEAGCAVRGGLHGRLGRVRGGGHRLPGRADYPRRRRAAPHRARRARAERGAARDKPRVRDGYTGMIVATGFASNRRLGRGS